MRRNIIHIGLVGFLVILIGLVTPQALAAPRPQATQPINIGIIGSFDGATAQGVTLAIRRFSAQGPVTTPDGITHTLSVVTAEATTPDEVATAITQLKTNNVVAIFGPDDDQLVIDSLSALQGAGVPIFTSATSTAIQSDGLLFRTRAADTWRMSALVDYLLTDLGRKKVAVFQGSEADASAVTVLNAELTKRGVEPLLPIVGSATTSEDASRQLIESEADAIVALGTIPVTIDIYRNVMAAGFQGTFATPNAISRSFIERLPQSLRGNIYGVTSWSYSVERTDSADFFRDYVALFGTIPTPLSASAYDSAVALAIAIKNGGTTPDQIRTTLLGFNKAESLQGFFNPKLGSNDLSASVSIIQTNEYGAPIVVARYEDTGRVTVPDIVPTAYPSSTFTPSPTPEGVVGTIRATVNVKLGPAETFQTIGQLRAGEQRPLIGANADLTWYAIDYRQQVSWIPANLVSVFGDVQSLPLLESPPTPTPAPVIPTATPVPPQPTALPTVEPFTDLVMVSAIMTPASPTSGQPFTLAVTVRNQGTLAAGPFAVATSFLPGDVFSAVNVPGLAAGTDTVVNLTGTVTGSGTFTIAIVLDLNNQVDEGPNGKVNNKPTFTYTVNP